MWGLFRNKNPIKKFVFAVLIGLLTFNFGFTNFTVVAYADNQKEYKDSDFKNQTDGILGVDGYRNNREVDVTEDDDEDDNDEKTLGENEAPLLFSPVKGLFYTGEYIIYWASVILLMYWFCLLFALIADSMFGTDFWVPLFTSKHRSIDQEGGPGKLFTDLCIGLCALAAYLSGAYLYIDLSLLKIIGTIMDGIINSISNL